MFISRTDMHVICKQTITGIGIPITEYFNWQPIGDQKCLYYLPNSLKKVLFQKFFTVIIIIIQYSVFINNVIVIHRIEYNMLHVYIRFIRKILYTFCRLARFYNVFNYNITCFYFFIYIYYKN